MKQITLNIPDSLYQELEEMKDRETDSVEKVAEDVLYDVVFEDEISEAWEHFNELDQLFEHVPILSEALQNFSDVIVICSDTGDLSKDQGMRLLQKSIELLDHYHKHEIPENLDSVISYLEDVYTTHKAALLQEAKRLASMSAE